VYFTRFPARKTESNDEFNAVNADNPPNQPTVLVVDDEPNNVKLLELLLHGEGYTTIAAKNGSEALTLAAAENPGSDPARRHDAGHGRLRNRGTPQG